MTTHSSPVIARTIVAAIVAMLAAFVVATAVQLPTVASWDHAPDIAAILALYAIAIRKIFPTALAAWRDPA